jgi:hypothetical protein
MACAAARPIPIAPPLGRGDREGGGDGLGISNARASACADAASRNEIASCPTRLLFGPAAASASTSAEPSPISARMTREADRSAGIKCLTTSDDPSRDALEGLEALRQRGSRWRISARSCTERPWSPTRSSSVAAHRAACWPPVVSGIPWRWGASGAMIHDGVQDFPAPVERCRRAEVDECMRADGSVLTAIALDRVCAALAGLRNMGARARWRCFGAKIEARRCRFALARARMAGTPFEDSHWSALPDRLSMGVDIGGSARASGAFKRACGVPGAEALPTILSGGGSSGSRLRTSAMRND